MELRSGTPQEAGLDPERLEVVRERCQEWIDDGTHPAIVALVVRNGVIALHEAYGRLGPEPDASPLRVDAIFPLASLTKPFTATALMILVDDGLVGLTRPVHEYVPEFTGEDKGLVCVHHLLTHTSGLEDTDVISYVRKHWDETASNESANAVSQWLCLAAAAPLTRRPGEEMAYGNVNYILVAEIVRRVSGLSFADFVRKRITEPLALESTSHQTSSGRSEGVVAIPAEWATEFARLVRPPQEVAEETLVGEKDVFWKVTARGPAGLVASAIDVAVFGQLFLNGGSYGGRRILSASAVREMTRNQIPGISARIFAMERHAEASWGYGWGIASTEKWNSFLTLPNGAFAHSGGSGTCLWCDPAHGIVGVFLSVGRIQATGLIWSGDLFANAVYSALN